MITPAAGDISTGSCGPRRSGGGRRGDAGPSHGQAMKIVNEKLDAYYKRHRIRNRIGDLRWGNVVNRQRETLTFPELKGVQIKAAAVRALIPFAAELATELDKGDEPAAQCDERSIRSIREGMLA
jgi:hypothetical protein